ncbi:universal stress protein [Natronorubrum aibiense]|uniref:Universal stress protein n=1 Tax=Natronorubrum aibiense TaxID=348826 RepID=A0A5P9P4S9_9EURY|nr:universal stress protein [Natronorubrum aibiense]QFU83128.1 universal stress protein [Natronorubrum aibiense]
MPQHVLVALDGSEQGFAALEYSLASFPDATRTALFVVDPTTDHDATVGAADSPLDHAEDRGERVLDRAAERADECGRSLRTQLRIGTPQTEILATTTDAGVDHVVLGTHGESPITRPFLGHVSEAVVRRAPITTTVVPETVSAVRDRELPESILVPIDGSEQAEAALEYALETFPDATHTALYVQELPFDRPREDVEGTYLEDILHEHETRAEEILESATAVAEDHGTTLETETVAGKPAAEILDYAEATDADQLVVGAHGRSLAARLFTGSGAERIARRSPRTVTIVRGAPTAE